MPNIITHKLFAEDVLQEIEQYDIKKIIETHTQSFYIGSNGPDFLFFSNVKPWDAYKSHALNHLGGKIHKTHINDFYEEAIKSIKMQKRQDIGEEMMAFLFGHLCHWALDKEVHPYIFYRTGNGKGLSAGYHHRFESMLDTIMLEKRKHIHIKEYPFYEICAYNEHILAAIARIYVPVARIVYQTEIKVHDLRKTLDSWYAVQKYLYDPNNKKFPIVQGLEKLLHKPWAISGNIVRPVVDRNYDIVNEEHRLWKNPCDAYISSTASFLDLYEQAEKDAINVVKQAYRCITQDAPLTTVLEILKDRAYDTGMAPGHKMKFFDIIYES